MSSVITGVLTLLNSIKAFTTFTDRLSTAGQPSVEAVPALGSAGFERVINLGLLDQPYSLPDERALVESASMTYRPIPAPFYRPQGLCYLLPP